MHYIYFMAVSHNGDQSYIRCTDLIHSDLVYFLIDNECILGQLAPWFWEKQIENDSPKVTVYEVETEQELENFKLKFLEDSNVN